MSNPRHDNESDPGHDDDLGTDWTAEGGAMPAGPATDPEDTTPDDDE